MWLVNSGKGILCIIAVLGVGNGRIENVMWQHTLPIFLFSCKDFFFLYINIRKMFEKSTVVVFKLVSNKGNIILTNISVRIQTFSSKLLFFS